MLQRASAVAALMGATAVSLSPFVRADTGLLSPTDVLSNSTNAIIVGGTFEPTPSLDYVQTAESLFLDPQGFSGPAANFLNVCDIIGTEPCGTPLQVLTTPELIEEGPSSLQTESSIIDAVEADYNAGGLSASDPLTIFAYSQSAISASAAESVLSKFGIPEADLKFVFIGDPSDANGVAPNLYPDLVTLFGGGATGTTLTDELLNYTNQAQFIPGGTLDGFTPDNLYQTTVYTIDTDGVADWQEDWNATLAAGGSPSDALLNDLYHFVTTHVEYLGLTPAEVASGVSTTDGLTTTITIPDGSDAGSIINDTTALLGSLTHGLADSGLVTGLVESLQDLFNPAYF